MTLCHTATATATSTATTTTMVREMGCRHMMRAQDNASPPGAMGELGYGGEGGWMQGQWAAHVVVGAGLLGYVLGLG